MISEKRFSMILDELAELLKEDFNIEQKAEITNHTETFLYSEVLK